MATLLRRSKREELRLGAWYYVDDTSKKKKLTFQELAEHYGSNIIDAETYLYNKVLGLKEWKRLGEIDGLKDEIAKYKPLTRPHTTRGGQLDRGRRRPPQRPNTTRGPSATRRRPDRAVPGRLRPFSNSPRKRGSGNTRGRQRPPPAHPPDDRLEPSFKRKSGRREKKTRGRVFQRSSSTPSRQPSADRRSTKSSRRLNTGTGTNDTKTSVGSTEPAPNGVFGPTPNFVSDDDQTSPEQSPRNPREKHTRGARTPHRRKRRKPNLKPQRAFSDPLSLNPRNRSPSRQSQSSQQSREDTVSTNETDAERWARYIETRNPGDRKKSISGGLGRESEAEPRKPKKEKKSSQEEDFMLDDTSPLEQEDFFNILRKMSLDPTPEMFSSFTSLRDPVRRRMFWMMHLPLPVEWSVARKVTVFKGDNYTIRTAHIAHVEGESVLVTYLKTNEQEWIEKKDGRIKEVNIKVTKPLMKLLERLMHKRDPVTPRPARPAPPESSVMSPPKRSRMSPRKMGGEERDTLGELGVSAPHRMSHSQSKTRRKSRLETKALRLRSRNSDVHRQREKLKIEKAKIRERNKELDRRKQELALKEAELAKLMRLTDKQGRATERKQRAEQKRLLAEKLELEDWKSRLEQEVLYPTPVVRATIEQLQKKPPKLLQEHRQRVEEAEEGRGELQKQCDAVAKELEDVCKTVKAIYDARADPDVEEDRHAPLMTSCARLGKLKSLYDKEMDFVKTFKPHDLNEMHDDVLYRIMKSPVHNFKSFDFRSMAFTNLDGRIDVSNPPSPSRGTTGAGLFKFANGNGSTTFDHDRQLSRVTSQSSNVIRPQPLSRASRWDTTMSESTTTFAHPPPPFSAKDMLSPHSGNNSPKRPLSPRKPPPIPQPDPPARRKPPPKPKPSYKSPPPNARNVESDREESFNTLFSRARSPVHIRRYSSSDLDLQFEKKRARARRGFPLDATSGLPPLHRADSDPRSMRSTPPSHLPRLVEKSEFRSPRRRASPRKRRKPGPARGGLDSDNEDRDAALSGYHSDNELVRRRPPKPMSARRPPSKRPKRR